MQLLIVAAMAVEARPVVDRLGLRGETAEEGGQPFRFYRRGDSALVVSGMGKAAAAAATAWAAARLAGEGPLAFLNFGSAGHRHREVGEVLLAHEVRDGGSGRGWFPPLVFDAPCATERVVTVDRIETGFEEEALYEMEASGFLETAQRFTTGELAHCVKFVSDNAQETVADLDLQRIGELAEQSLEPLLAVARELRALGGELEASRSLPEVPAGFWEGWRFSVTQERQKVRLLARWRALAPGRPLPLQLLETARNGREALRRLQGAVEALARGPEDRP